MGELNDNSVEQGSYSRTVKYLGIFGGAQGVSMLLNLVRNKVASVLLGVSGLSVIAIFNRTIQMFSDCTGLSLSFSAIRTMADTYENADTDDVLRCVKVVRSVAFLTGVVGMLLMLCVTPFISEWIFGENHAYYLPRFLMLAPVVFFMAISNGELAILRGVKQLNKVAVYTFATALISLLVAVPLYYIMGVGGIFPTILLTAFLQMCVLLYFSCPSYRYSVSPFSLALLREGWDMIKLGAGYIYASILASCAMWLICAMLSDIGDGETAGLFTAGLAMVTMLPGILFAALDSEYYPRLSGMAKRVSVRNGMVNEQVEVQLLIQSPVLIAFMVAMPLLIPLLYDSDFMPAVVMAQVAMLGMFMRTMTYPISFLPLASSDSLLFLGLESVYNVMLVLFVLAGYSSYSMLGIGMGVALTHIVDFVIVYTVARFKYGFSLSRRVVLYFIMQLPLMLAALSLSFVQLGGLFYWIGNGACVLLSSLVSIYFLHKYSGFLGKIVNKFRRKKGIK